ncbi:hypothetical protein BDZ89DRAFT_352582 [Hymenopellis radicata]|nr:hypothetical protein BDZ89DRAFT_352582 [Hymenopellis radicata]
MLQSFFPSCLRAFELWLNLGPSNSPTSQTHYRRYAVLDFSMCVYAKPYRNSHDSTPSHNPRPGSNIRDRRRLEHVHRCAAFAGYRSRLASLLPTTMAPQRRGVIQL